SLQERETDMENYLFIGGNLDGLSVPVQPDQDTIQLPAGVTGKDNYIRDTLAVGNVSITIYRHESLTSEQVLELVVKHYKARCWRDCRMSHEMAGYDVSFPLRPTT